jgi:hypothetical protein
MKPIAQGLKFEQNRLEVILDLTQISFNLPKMAAIIAQNKQPACFCNQSVL